MRAIITILAIFFTSSAWSQTESIDNKKWISTLEINLYSGSSEDAPGANLSLLYLFNQSLGVGPLVNFIDYDSRLRESMLNLGIRGQFICYKMKENYAFLSLDGGMGIPFYEGKGDWRDSPADGQFFIQPGVGIVISTARGSGILFKVGYHHQTLTTEFIPERVNREETTYKRWNFGFGFTF